MFSKKWNKEFRGRMERHYDELKWLYYEQIGRAHV